MKSFKAFVLLFILVTSTGFHEAVADATLHLPNMYGEAVPSRIGRWTKIIYVGPATSAPPNVFVSPEKFKRTAPDVLIRLSSQQYNFFSSLIRGRQCLGMSDSRRGAAIIEVAMAVGGSKAAICAMERAAACEYLSAMAVSELSWRESKWQPVRMLMKGVGC